MAGQSGIWISPGMHDISAESLTSGWTLRYGIPMTITIDRDGQFKSHLTQELSRILGI